VKPKLQKLPPKPLRKVAPWKTGSGSHLSASYTFSQSKTNALSL